MYSNIDYPVERRTSIKYLHIRKTLEYFFPVTSRSSNILKLYTKYIILSLHIRESPIHKEVLLMYHIDSFNFNVKFLLCIYIL